MTRGPSLDPNEKRLAVHVEDHPIEYNAFEGTIPQGEYGGGTVMIWDRGRWLPEGDPHKGYAKGHLVFDLGGEKLHGSWSGVNNREQEPARQLAAHQGQGRGSARSRRTGHPRGPVQLVVFRALDRGDCCRKKTYLAQQSQHQRGRE